MNTINGAVSVSPGTGKTMLAKRVPTVLPQVSAPESIETTRIYGALGQLPAGQPLLARRPFRSPHHTISELHFAEAINYRNLDRDLWVS